MKGERSTHNVVGHFPSHLIPTIALFHYSHFTGVEIQANTSPVTDLSKVM